MAVPTLGTFFANVKRISETAARDVSPAAIRMGLYPLFPEHKTNDLIACLQLAFNADFPTADEVMIRKSAKCTNTFVRSICRQGFPISKTIHVEVQFVDNLFTVSLTKRMVTEGLVVQRFFDDSYQANFQKTTIQLLVYEDSTPSLSSFVHLTADEGVIPFIGNNPSIPRIFSSGKVDVNALTLAILKTSVNDAVELNSFHTE